MDTGLTFEEQQLQGRTFLKKLGIPNPYSMYDIHKADHR